MIQGRPMARLTWCTIQGYKSIRDPITIQFPEGMPLVLIGENNAGKSNIVSALDLVLGESWPGTREPEDHDFWGRDPQTGSIRMEVGLSGVFHPKTGQPVTALLWQYDPHDEEGILFRGNVDGQWKFVSNDLRNQLIAVTIGADRRLSYQLSYSSKYTLLSKLMRKFHTALVSDPNRVERLKVAFKTLEDIFREVEEFAKFEAGLAEQFGEMFAGMSYGLQVDFSAYDPSRFFHSLRVVPKEGNERRTFDELGTGQEQILALAFAHAYARAFYGGIVLIIEEPEAHLHPLAQRWLARQIRQMCEDGLQVILTTHSPAFIDILGLEGLVLVRKKNSATYVRQLSREELAGYCIAYGSHPSKTSPDTILPFYAAHATEEILSGFFAKAIVLVEGPTEFLALPVYLRRVGLDVTRAGIAIIPVMGKGNLAKWWRLFTAYGFHVYVIFDNDTRDDKNATHRNDILSTIGVNDPKEIDEAINTEEWLIKDTYCVFGKDFEQCLRATFGDEYKSLENAARDMFGDSKPIIARYVAEQLTGIKNGWPKVQQLRDKIMAMVTKQDDSSVENGQHYEDVQEEFPGDFWDDVPF